MDGKEQSTQRVESLGEAPVWLECAVLRWGFEAGSDGVVQLTVTLGVAAVVERGRPPAGEGGGHHPTGDNSDPARLGARYVADEEEASTWR
jgi:hypothetical protein